jgi:hypothetical protein
MDTYTAIVLVLLVIVTEQFLVVFAKKWHKTKKLLQELEKSQLAPLKSTDDVKKDGENE